MAANSLFQIIAAALGVIGSLFFSIGILRQSPEAMAELAGTYFDYNPAMVPSLAAQKADYVFGGSIIVLAFAVQLASFLVDPAVIAVGSKYSSAVAWIAIAVVLIAFPALRYSAKALAGRFERQINERLRQRAEAARLDLEARKAATQSAQVSRPEGTPPV